MDTGSKRGAIMNQNIQTAAALLAKKRHEKDQLNTIIKPRAEQQYAETKSENYFDYQAIVSDLIKQGDVVKRNDDDQILDERTFNKWLKQWQNKEQQHG